MGWAGLGLGLGLEVGALAARCRGDTGEIRGMGEIASPGAARGAGNAGEIQGRRGEMGLALARREVGEMQGDTGDRLALARRGCMCGSVLRSPHTSMSLGSRPGV